MSQSGLLLAQGETPLALLPAMANRHGLIAGATGTGKTVTLQVLAEALSGIGVPVFMADVKGDLAGVSQAGVAKPKLLERAAQLGITFTPHASPVMVWDLFGEQGQPVRGTVSDMGPLLLARLLDLNETQEGVLNLAFKIADDDGLLLLDLKDLRALLTYLGDNAKEFTTRYGNVSAQSIGAIQRGLLTLESQGGDAFFGETALQLSDLMRCDQQGHGYINILAADKLMQSPRLYATFLLWLLAELFEGLPEAGDLEKPKLVFFFDEAHLLFSDAPKALVEKVEQVVRLIRSKGVGVFFVTQNPLDIPETILGQLGNRVQHALRAFTPRDQKAVRSAAETLRSNPKLDVASAITELAVGEALVSFLDEKATPSIVQRALIRPPSGRLGPISPEERQALMAASPVRGKYDERLDRESAYERLSARGEKAAPASAQKTAPAQKPHPADEAPDSGIFGDLLAGAKKSGRSRQGIGETLAKSVARTVGSQLGRQLVRGILGALLKR